MAHKRTAGIPVEDSIGLLRKFPFGFVVGFRLRSAIRLKASSLEFGALNLFRGQN